jgi:hypothetical protein
VTWLIHDVSRCSDNDGQILFPLQAEWLQQPSRAKKEVIMNILGQLALASMERNVEQMIEQGKFVRTQFLRANSGPALRMVGTVVALCAVAIVMLVGIAHQRASEATVQMLSKSANFDENIVSGTGGIVESEHSRTK